MNTINKINPRKYQIRPIEKSPKFTIFKYIRDQEKYGDTRQKH